MGKETLPAIFGFSSPTVRSVPALKKVSRIFAPVAQMESAVFNGKILFELWKIASFLSKEVLFTKVLARLLETTKNSLVEKLGV